mmetsp:Transcript_9186/g.55774  ORF Transcript_9186/g.55774 Transcript_9186/m.55774 type:complete len:214 (-) Transcript_9186:441-1082(-)
MIQRFSVLAEPRLVVCTHHAASGPSTYGTTQVGLTAGTVQAFSTECLVARHHVVSRHHGRDVFAHGFNHTRGFVSQDARKQSFWIASGERVGVGVAQCGGVHLHAHLSSLRRCHFHLRHFQRCVRLPCDRSFARDRGRHRSRRWVVRFVAPIRLHHVERDFEPELVRVRTRSSSYQTFGFIRFVPTRDGRRPSVDLGWCRPRDRCALAMGLDR